MLSINDKRRARTTPIRNLGPAAVLLAAGLAACSPSSEEGASVDAAAAPPGNFDFEGWDQYLGGADSSQYSSLKQIDKSNVGQLEVAWTYPTTENYSFNPLVVGNTMYVLAKGRSIVALDAATGRELWAHANEGAVGTRGMNYWRSADGSEERLLYVNAGHLTAIDAKTGETIRDLRHRRPRRPARRPRRRHHDDSRAADQQPGPDFRGHHHHVAARPEAAATRRRRPTFTRTTSARACCCGSSTPCRGPASSAPRPGRKAGLGNYGGVHNWSESTVDAELGIVYMPTGTARYDFYGGNRHGENLFGNSLLALDARSGKRLWHFQTIHHDLWDYDLPTAPKLLTVVHDGVSIPAIAQPSKQGFVYVFNRITGAPLWPIEERPVPQSDTPGEMSWPTQPFPTAPPPFARQSFTEADINPHISAEDQAKVREFLRTARNEGLYTPPSLQGAVMMPGHNGGTNWGSSAVDPQNGRLYVVSKELPTTANLRVPQPPAAGVGPGRRRRTARRWAGRRGNRPPPLPPPNAGPDFIPYTAPADFMIQPSTGLSAIGPPWSQLTAYDLNEGTILWQIPNGDVASLASQGTTGTGSHAPRGGVVATGGGLLFVGTSSDRKFRAYDADTGKVLWSYDLPAATEGVPAVYSVGGKQYVAIAVGGNGLFSQGLDQSEPGPGHYLVFALGGSNQ